MVTHDRVLHYVVTTLCIITAQRPLLLIPTLLQTARRVARQSLTRRVFTVSLDGILSLVLVESRVVLCSNVQCRRVARERQAVPCSPGSARLSRLGVCERTVTLAHDSLA